MLAMLSPDCSISQSSFPVNHYHEKRLLRLQTNRSRDLYNMLRLHEPQTIESGSIQEPKLLAIGFPRMNTFLARVMIPTRANHLPARTRLPRRE